MAEKAAAALALIEEWGKAPAAVPNPTKEKARNLFEAINRYFDELA